jgi:hypothetical protein
MMKNKIPGLIFIFLFQTLVFGQKNDLKLNIDLNFNSDKIVIGENYTSKNKDILNFETIKFYLSNFEILYTDNSTSKEENSYHLIDIENPESLVLNLKSEKNKEIKTLKFKIGVDSLASVSGAMEGDLDATKGMYWAWQSGFINLKIEGKSKSCETRNNKFHFHVGGYLAPNYAIRAIEIPIKNSQIQNNSLHLKVDLAKLFDEIELNKINSIMIPGKEAMKIADLSTQIFSVE